MYPAFFERESKQSVAVKANIPLCLEISVMSKMPYRLY